MAIKPLQGITPEWFTPKSEEDSENPTRFRIKPLNSEQLDYVMEGAAMGQNGDVVDISARGKTYALRHGLLEWENFDCKFSHANFSKLPWPVRTEIAWKIVEISFMPEEAAKNS